MPRSGRQRLVLALVVSSLVLSLGVPQALALQVGDKAPEFELPGTTADVLKLSDYAGKKPVVLFFYIGAFTKG